MASRSSASNNNSNMRLYIILGILAFAIIVGVLVGSQYKEKFTNDLIPMTTTPTSSSIALYYFYSETCGYCSDFDKTWKNLANNNKYYNALSFMKFDVDDNEKTTGKKYGDLYNVPYYPYIMLVKTEIDKYVFDPKTERTEKNIIKWVNDNANLNLPLE